MQIVVNGEPKETGARTLDELCAALGMSADKFATAVNGAFVPARARTKHQLHVHDEIEIVTPRQGG